MNRRKKAPRTENYSMERREALTRLRPRRNVFRFLDLPAELRNEVYEYCYCPDPVIAVRHSGCDSSLTKQCRDACFASVFRVCRQVRQEAQDLFYKSKLFLYQDSEKPLWEDASDPDNVKAQLQNLFSSIRSLELTHWHDESNVTVERDLRHCKSLRHLTIEVNGSSLFDGMMGSAELEGMSDKVQYIAQIRGLETLVLRCPSASGPFGATAAPPCEEDLREAERRLRKLVTRSAARRGERESRPLQSQVLRLLDLPSGVRNMIYQEVCWSVSVLDLTRAWGNEGANPALRSRKSFVRPVFQANRQLRSEAYDILYGSTQFHAEEFRNPWPHRARAFDMPSWIEQRLQNLRISKWNVGPDYGEEIFMIDPVMRFSGLKKIVIDASLSRDAAYTLRWESSSEAESIDEDRARISSWCDCESFTTLPELQTLTLNVNATSCENVRVLEAFRDVLRTQEQNICAELTQRKQRAV